MTRSPGLNAVTPAPTLSTTPANSPPGENGNGGLVWYLPAMISVSKKFSPTAATLATTSPRPATGSGISASTRSSGAPKRWQRMAFTGGARGLLERCRHAIARTTALEVLHAWSVYYGGQRTGRSHSPSHCRIPQAVHAVCRVSRFGLLQPSWRWADDRDEICHRIDPCHIAGVGRICATTAAKTCHAAAAEA